MKTAQTWADHNLAYPLSAARMTYGEERTTEASWVNATGGGFINVAAAPYNAKGDGVTNDGPAINSALAAAKGGGAVFIPPGEFFTQEALKIPESTRLFGLNRWSSTITGTGNINVLDLTGLGDISINSLEIRTATKQASGSAINFSNGFVTEAHIYDLNIGSRFFNGFNIVGATGCSAVNIHDIHMIEFNGALKEYGNAAFVIGNTETAKRAFNVWLHGIIIQANSGADVPIGIQLNNADSVQLETVLMQSTGKGLVVGNADASAQRTTNLMANGVQADGCANAGFELASCIDATIDGCRAEACGLGLSLGEFTVRNTISGNTFYFNVGHGIEVKNSVAATYLNTITGNTIAQNGQSKAAGTSGIFIADKATGAIGGLTITGNTIGNAPLFGAAEQKIGITLGKECENIGVYGNRFVANGTSALKQNGGEKAVNNKSLEAEIKTAIEAHNQLT